MRFTGPGSSSVRVFRKNEICGTLRKEQTKLEKMVLEVLENGVTNLGNNADILKQSLEVDKLIVEEMLQLEANRNISDDYNIADK